MVCVLFPHEPSVSDAAITTASVAYGPPFGLDQDAGHESGCLHVVLLCGQMGELRVLRVLRPDRVDTVESP
jgi:hypothetical protein